MRPLVLVNCWRRELPTFLGERTALETLDPAYAAGVAAAGGRPLLLSRPQGDLAETVDELITLADGLMLTGGGDVDPAAYGAPPENVEGDDIAADAWELALLAAAEAHGVPTLAICRGAQLLAVAHGGRLSQRPAATEGHQDLGGLSPQQILSARHPVSLVAGTRLQRVFARPSVDVNTIHHHQIADAGDLQVSAIAPGGVIEAVEPRTEWACIGVQWHPEKMREPEQRVLFERLVHEARRRAAHRGAQPRPGLAA